MRLYVVEMRIDGGRWQPLPNEHCYGPNQVESFFKRRQALEFKRKFEQTHEYVFGRSMRYRVARYDRRP